MRPLARSAAKMLRSYDRALTVPSPTPMSSDERSRPTLADDRSVGTALPIDRHPHAAAMRPNNASQWGLSIQRATATRSSDGASHTVFSPAPRANTPSSGTEGYNWRPDRIHQRSRISRPASSGTAARSTRGDSPARRCIHTACRAAPVRVSKPSCRLWATLLGLAHSLAAGASCELCDRTDLIASKFPRSGQKFGYTTSYFRGILHLDRVMIRP